MLNAGYYSLGPHSVLVYIRTINKLAFPWLYLVLAIWIGARMNFPGKWQSLTTGFILVLVISPYSFLTYQEFLPSRHLYLACMPVSFLFTQFYHRLPRKSLQVSMLTTFLVVNMAYIWIKKDAQYESRGSPTTKLIQIFESTTPQPICVEDFPLNPWIAKLSTRQVQGWKPDMIVVNKSGVRNDCILLQWQEGPEDYLETTDTRCQNSSLNDFAVPMNLDGGLE
jgi:hypothetical protein